MTRILFGNVPANMTDTEWFGYAASYDSGEDYDIVYITPAEVLLRDPLLLSTVRFNGTFDTSSIDTILASPLDSVEWRDGGGGLLFNWSGLDVTVGQALEGEEDPAVVAAVLGGADSIDGGAGSDWLRGYDGNDTISGGGGNDTIDGGGGLDTAVFAGLRAGYDVSLPGEFGGGTDVVDLFGGGSDTLIDIERLVWEDAAVGLDIDGIAAQAYRIYKAAFDREPDLAGLGYWIAQLDEGASLFDAATGFLGSAEFQSLYGVNPSNEEYTRALYLNVLDREPDEAGYAYWNAVLSGETWNGIYYGQTTREQMLVDFSESAENQANVIGLIADGIEYVPWG